MSWTKKKCDHWSFEEYMCRFSPSDYQGKNDACKTNIDLNTIRATLSYARRENVGTTCTCSGNYHLEIHQL